MKTTGLNDLMYGATGFTRTDLEGVDSFCVWAVVWKMVRDLVQEASESGDADRISSLASQLENKNWGPSTLLASVTEAASVVFHKVCEPEAHRVISREPLELAPANLSDAAMPPDIRDSCLDRLQQVEEDWNEELRAVTETLKSRDSTRLAEFEPPAGPPELDRVHILIICQQFAAARACMLRRVGGSVDDLLTALERGRRAGLQLHAEPPGSGPEHALRSSCVKAQGVILYELSRIHRVNGEYEQALHVLGAAALCVDDSVGEFPLNLDVNLPEAEEIIEGVFAHPRGVDWKKVAGSCRTLASFDALWDSDYGFHNDGEMYEVPFTVFRDLGHIASGRAAARLTNEDQLDLLQKAEDDAAERRLRRYFFSSTWPILPKRVQEALVDADRAFFATTRGRPTSMLNDLRVASEELCKHTIWVPLDRARADDRLGWFLEIEAKLEGKMPALGTYRAILARSEYGYFIDEDLGLPGDLKSWLKGKDLRSALYQLQVTRNIVEHTDQIVDAEKRDDLYLAFVGIGHRRDGVLTHLADVYSVLRDSGSQRLDSAGPSLQMSELVERLTLGDSAMTD